MNKKAQATHKDKRKLQIPPDNNSTIPNPIQNQINSLKNVLKFKMSSDLTIPLETRAANQMVFKT